MKMRNEIGLQCCLKHILTIHKYKQEQDTIIATCEMCQNVKNYKVTDDPNELFNTHPKYIGEIGILLIWFKDATIPKRIECKKEEIPIYLMEHADISFHVYFDFLTETCYNEAAFV